MLTTMADIPKNRTRIRWRFNFAKNPDGSKNETWYEGEVRYRDSRKDRIYIAGSTYGCWVELAYLEFEVAG